MSRPTIDATSFAGRKVLFVMAAEAEYGAELRKRFTALITGVGPVEAAISLTANLCALEAKKALPDLIVSLGSAGSRVLEEGEIYQVSDVSYRDMDATALGFDKGVTPFRNEPAVIPLPYVLPELPRASLSSGANVVSGFGYDGILAQMVDMETFSHVRVASEFSIPVIGLRGISDGKSDVTEMAHWTAGLEALDRRLAAAVDKLAHAIESGAIPA
jgi:adenosylhomocysteine nucleosidase